MTTTKTASKKNENRDADGRYAGCPCELCGKPAGVEPFSADYALAHGYVGLCERCASDEVHGGKFLARKLAARAKAAASFVPSYLVSFRKTSRSPSVYCESFETEAAARAFAETVKLVDLRLTVSRFSSVSILAK